MRAALLRHGRAGPRPEELAGAERRVFIVLWKAWGMGGTIRAAFNLAEYLVEHGYEVEIISAVRDREDPFFGGFPAGVKVTALEDRLAPPRGLRGLVQRTLAARASMLVPKVERAAHGFSMWSDVALARRLSGRAGYLIGTRPAINFALAMLRPPALITIGLEQMNLDAYYWQGMRRVMRRRYPRLDALVVLTEQDRGAYRELLDQPPPLYRIPNTVRPLPGAKADLAARTVYAAGRFRNQKGFDLLLAAWEIAARDHLDWTLRLRGEGALKADLETMVAEHGLQTVSFEGPTEDIGADMAEASIFVLSSRFEGFPLILLEAMSKGMAVAAFDCPTGPADIVADHENGLLVPAEDVDGLARAIREMIEDEELRRRAGAAAIETAQRYTIEEIGPLWIEMFEELSRTSSRFARA